MPYKVFLYLQVKEKDDVVLDDRQEYLVLGYIEFKGGARSRM